MRLAPALYTTNQIAFFKPDQFCQHFLNGKNEKLPKVDFKPPVVFLEKEIHPE